jgi:hypothetical protein
MEFLSDIHSILFNAHILFSLALGVWAALLATRDEPISGNYWGAVATYAGLAAIITLIGIIMALDGLRPGPDDNKRLTLYILYMAFLTVIMPGLFSMMRGRDDRSAAFAFSVLAVFNAAVSLSMVSRMVVGPWT